MATSIRITGASAIQRAFKELPPRLAKKVIRQALRAGAKVVQAEAKADAPVETGKVKKAIKVRAGKSRKKNVIAMAVIIGQGDFQGETFYGAFENFGWKTGKRGSSNRRQVPGKHFMDRALSEKAAAAKEIITGLILEGIEREARGLAGQGTGASAIAAGPPAASSSAGKGPKAGRDERGRFLSKSAGGNS